MNDSLARVLRTIAQLVAGGGLTVFYDQVIHNIDAKWQPYVALGFTLLVAVCQNLIEESSGKGVLRPSSPPASGTVDTVAKV